MGKSNDFYANEPDTCSATYYACAAGLAYQQVNKQKIYINSIIKSVLVRISFIAEIITFKPKSVKSYCLILNLNIFSN